MTGFRPRARRLIDAIKRPSFVTTQVSMAYLFGCAIAMAIAMAHPSWFALVNAFMAGVCATLFGYNFVHHAIMRSYKKAHDAMSEALQAQVGLNKALVSDKVKMMMVGMGYDGDDVEIGDAMPMPMRPDKKLH